MKNRAGACNPGRRPSEGHPYEHKAEGLRWPDTTDRVKIRGSPWPLIFRPAGGKFLQKFSRIGPAQFGVAG